MADSATGFHANFIERARIQAAAASFYLLAIANVAVLFSIALSQTLLGLGLAALLLARRKPEAPPPARVLALFVAWTLLCLALSPEPLLGFPQVKKFYILLALPAAYMAFRNVVQVDRVFRALFIAGAAAGLLAISEFGLYYSSLHASREFYSAYSRSRVTGFMSHWQTFSGQQALLAVVLLAFLLTSARRPWWSWLAGALIGLSLVLSFTRGAWLGALAGVVYLLWRLRRRWLLAIPAVLLLAYLVAPGLARERVRSLTDLRGDSSNQARLLMLRTGLNMIRAHPVFGLGPEGVRHYFNAYRPVGPTPEAWYGHLHSNYMQLAAERGLPGLALFLVFLLMVFVDHHRLAARLAPEYRYIALGMAAAAVAFAVSGVFEYSFGDSEVAMLFLFCVSHGYVAARGAAGAPKPGEAAAGSA